MPTNGCIKQMMALLKHKRGLGIPSFLDVSEKFWLRKRYHFKNSSQLELNQVWNDSSKEHVKLDAVICEADKLSKVSNILRKQQLAGKESFFLGLKMQGEAPKTILEAITRKNIASWNSLTENLPQFVFQFLFTTVITDCIESFSLG